MSFSSLNSNKVLSFKKTLVFIFGIMTPLLANSSVVQNLIELPAPPSINYKNMGKFNEKTIIELKGDEISLTAPTYISADQVVISTLIITNGYEFRIDTKELIFQESFGKNGEILGFDKSASPGGEGLIGNTARRGQKGPI